MNTDGVSKVKASRGWGDQCPTESSTIKTGDDRQSVQGCGESKKMVKYLIRISVWVILSLHQSHKFGKLSISLGIILGTVPSVPLLPTTPDHWQSRSCTHEPVGPRKAIVYATLIPC